jgi:hypothetical protein
VKMSGTSSLLPLELCEYTKRETATSVRQNYLNFPFSNTKVLCKFCLKKEFDE